MCVPTFDRQHNMALALTWKGEPDVRWDGTEQAAQRRAADLRLRLDGSSRGLGYAQHPYPSEAAASA